MPTFDFQLLNEVETASLYKVLSNPKISKHLPLFETDIDLEWVSNWVQLKMGLWNDKKLGPYAVLLNNDVVGWCGYQPDGEYAELAIVLSPVAWGIGADVVNELNRLWKIYGDGRKRVFYLPTSRNADLISNRLGMEKIGTTDFNGIVFNVFEITD